MNLKYDLRICSVQTRRGCNERLPPDLLMIEEIEEGLGTDPRRLVPPRLTMFVWYHQLQHKGASFVSIMLLHLLKGKFLLDVSPS